jgi:hypothetical protein
VKPDATEEEVRDVVFNERGGQTIFNEAVVRVESVIFTSYHNPILLLAHEFETH